MNFSSIKKMKNTYLKLLIYIFLGFIILDSLQLFLYPLMIFNIISGLEDIVRKQLPALFRNLNIYIIFTILILNVVIRITATIQILKEKISGLILGILSCLYTISIVVFLLTANIWWESIVMIGLMVILILGYKKIIRKEP